MQAVTRNPLADPGILGVIGGAALAVVIGIAFFGLADPTAYCGRDRRRRGRGGLRLQRRLTRTRRRDPAQARARRRGDLGGVRLAHQRDPPAAARRRDGDVPVLAVGGVGGATWDRIALVLPVLIVGAVIVPRCAPEA